MSGWRKRQIMEKEMCGVNRPLDKEEFVQQYVLTRAGTRNDGFDAKGAAATAMDVWDKIHDECAAPKVGSPSW